MNPFKTIGRWLWRWWTGHDDWKPRVKASHNFVAVELVKSPPDVIEKTQALFGRQLDAAIREGIFWPDDTLNVVVGDTKPSDGSEFLEVVSKLRRPNVLIGQEPTDCSNATPRKEATDKLP